MPISEYAISSAASPSQELTTVPQTLTVSLTREKILPRFPEGARFDNSSRRCEDLHDTVRSRSYEPKLLTDGMQRHNRGRYRLIPFETALTVASTIKAEGN